MLVKSTIVDEYTFLVVDLSHGSIGSIENVRAIVLAVFAHGKGQFGGRIDTAIEDVCNGIARFLARYTSPENGSDVRMILVLLQHHGTNRVHDQDSVRAVCRNTLDGFVRILPERQVVSVSEIAVRLQIPLSSYRTGENDGDVSASGEFASRPQVPVVQARFVSTTIGSNLILDRGIRGNEVREFGSPTDWLVHLSLPHSSHTHHMCLMVG